MDAAREDEFHDAYPSLFSTAFRVAYRMLGQPGAEDVAAEAMARAYAHWNRIETGARKAWVMRVSANLAINLLRRRPPQLEQPRPISFEDLVVTRAALHAALLELSKRQREVVVLRYLGDASEEEVSRTLGIAPGSVKTHLRRGLESLRRVLGDGDLRPDDEGRLTGAP